MENARNGFSRSGRCSLGVGLFLLAGLGGGCGEGRDGPSTVLLVTVDGVRVDRVAARSTAPRLEALGDAGVRFSSARTPVPHRRSALATLMTGLAPAVHQLRDDGHVLFEEHESLAERLGAAGWSTAAFVAPGALVEEAGLGQGFAVRERFDEEGEDALVARAAEWLAEDRAERRFVWCHLDGPSAPYLPVGGDPRDGFSFFEVDARGRPLHPGNDRAHRHARGLVVFGRKPTSAAERKRALALKDAEVRAFDARLGRLVGAAGEGALVVVAGTHGESLGEHGVRFDHVEEVFDSTLRVPLVLAGGGLPALEETAPVDLADVAPTLLDHLGLEVPAAATGRSLTAAWRGGAIEARPTFAQSGPPTPWPGHPRFASLVGGAASPAAAARSFRDPSLRLRALVTPSRRKFVLDPIDGALSAFELDGDPGESVDRSADPAWADDVARARALLETIVALDRARVLAASGSSPPRLPPLDRAVVGLLREAGYL